MGIRQKTYAIFIKPYVSYNGDRIIHRGSVYIRTPGSNNQNDYTTVQKGETWMLYENNITSLTIAQQKIKTLMDTLGYPKADIKITEVLPLDFLITPSM